MAPDRAAAHKPDIRPLAPPLLWPLGAQGLRRPRRARGGPLGRAPTGRAPPPRPRSSPAAPGCASPGIVPRVPGRGRGHFREGRFPASPAPRQGARELAPGPRPPAPAGREEKRVLSGRAPRGSPASSGLSHAGPPGASLSLHLTLGCPPRSPLLALRQFQQAPWALPPRPPPARPRGPPAAVSEPWRGHSSWPPCSPAASLVPPALRTVPCGHHGPHVAADTGMGSNRVKLQRPCFLGPTGLAGGSERERFAIVGSSEGRNPGAARGTFQTLGCHPSPCSRGLPARVAPPPPPRLRTTLQTPTTPPEPVGRKGFESRGNYKALHVKFFPVVFK